MNRLEKQDLISNLNDSFSSYDSFVVVQYKGLTVADLEDLRRKSLKLDVSFKIIKNSLASIAVKDTKNSVLDEFLIGPTAIAWGEDPVSCAKVIYEFSKDNSNLKIVGGSYNGSKLTEVDISKLAKLPPIDEIRGKLVGLLTAAAAKIAILSKTPASNVVGVLQSYSNSQK